MPLTGNLLTLAVVVTGAKVLLEVLLCIGQVALYFPRQHSRGIRLPAPNHVREREQAHHPFSLGFYMLIGRFIVIVGALIFFAALCLG